MNQKDNNSNKLTWRDILSILQIAIPILSPSFLQYFSFFSKLLLQLSQYSKIPLSVLRSSLILMCFVILSLYMTTTYLIKFYKNQPFLPPKKDIKKICKYLVKHGSISTIIMMKQLGYSNTKAILYPDLLKEAGYLRGAFMIDPPTRETYYGLGKNGEIFVVKHKLD